MKPEKHEQRKEKIIVAAIQLFNRYGFRKTTLEDIAREAGVGKATLYHYVEGKDELFTEMVERLFQRFKGRLETVLAMDCSSRQKLVRYADAWLAHHREMQEASPLSVDERIEQFPNMHRHIKRFHQMEHKVMCTVLHEGIHQGEFRPVEVERVATLLVAAFKGMVAELWRQPGEYPPVVEGFLDVLFNGLLSSKTRG